MATALVQEIANGYIMTLQDADDEGDTTSITVFLPNIDEVAGGLVAAFSANSEETVQ